MIRKCEAKDLPNLREIAIATYRDTFHQNTSDENLALYFKEAYNLDTLKQELENPLSEVYLLESDEEIVAYLKLNIEDAQTEPMGKETLEVQRIYVLKEHKRNGYGKQLMQLAETRARAFGKKSIWLGVWEHNEAAKAFYQNHGFEHVGEHRFLAGNQVDIDWIMLKHL